MIGGVEGQGELNVLGEALQPCSSDPLTGFFRTGYCAAGPDSAAVHLVCIEASEAFLAFSKAVGNDLSTPMPQFAFPGLVAGNRWCLVAGRWLQAHEARMAPRIYLRATNQAVLGLIPLEVLKPYALDLN
ncbi:hypothetical protein WH87_15575 [Devosia epidermidihirudinis]|uniref:DUF2237 domain-containing protein n=1 Tax=Devosia epidermidihirudinis TaxID=1293439 RepID=A0A0F5Q3J1_9HYPH|nr:DUF2237 domain-containing protein [Devosia epidermidihirudinis]KKC35493.1 hypothetical protein WH87_15575 [Devosia epidermidihirudinis]